GDRRLHHRTIRLTDCEPPMSVRYCCATDAYRREPGGRAGNFMSIHLHRDLENAQRHILALASTVEETVEKAIRALFERDRQLAQAVHDGDTAIDLEENEIEEDCLKILALHQPVAVDLRRVAAIMKINTDLERMGDLATNIAERADALASGPAVPVPG